jgi:hypothetical protein
MALFFASFLNTSVHHGFDELMLLRARSFLAVVRLEPAQPFMSILFLERFVKQ